MDVQDPSPTTGEMTPRLGIQEAKRVCLGAASTGMAIARFEGFIRHEDGFEARLDCIWEPKPARTLEDVVANNADAAHQVEHDNDGCDHFILTMWPVEAELASWRKKSPTP